MTKKLTNLSKLSLATILGLSSCAHVEIPSRPFFKSILPESSVSKPDPVAKDPNKPTLNNNLNYGSFVYSLNYSGFSNSTVSDSSAEQSYGTNLTNYNLQLPKELTARDTYVDAGLVQIAFGDDSLKVRPIYSDSYDLSLRHPLRIEKSQDRETRPYNDFSFQNSLLGSLPEDDIERVKHDESAAIAALAKWIWSWDFVKPVKVVADDVRGYSNDAVRSVFGSHSEIDYSGGRIVFGYTGITTDYFDIELNAWADVGDLGNQGLILQMNLHGRR